VNQKKPFVTQALKGKKMDWGKKYVADRVGLAREVKNLIPKRSYWKGYILHR